MQQLLDPIFLIQTVGLAGVLFIIFAESGLFFGFFFPGDSLLFTAGLLSSQGYFYFGALLVGTILAAILGDSVGYWFGKKVGPRLFIRDDSLFFKKQYVLRTKSFYEQHGKKTIILARFIPIVRTFAPIVAGVAEMPYRIFLAYNVIGGVMWTTVLLSIGFFLGRSIPNIDKYILPIILGIIILSLLVPFLFSFRKQKTETI